MKCLSRKNGQYGKGGCPSVIQFLYKGSYPREEGDVLDIWTFRPTASKSEIEGRKREVALLHFLEKADFDAFKASSAFRN
jgi:hypothetical protein